jgi:hypothetical protein
MNDLLSNPDRNAATFLQCEGNYFEVKLFFFSSLHSHARFGHQGRLFQGSVRHSTGAGTQASVELHAIGCSAARQSSTVSGQIRQRSPQTLPWHGS